MGFYVIVELCLCACLGIGDGRTSRLAAVGFASHGRSYFTSQFFFSGIFPLMLFFFLSWTPSWGLEVRQPLGVDCAARSVRALEAGKSPTLFFLSVSHLSV